MFPQHTAFSSEMNFTNKKFFVHVTKRESTSSLPLQLQTAFIYLQTQTEINVGGTEIAE